MQSITTRLAQVILAVCFFALSEPSIAASEPTATPVQADAANAVVNAPSISAALSPGRPSSASPSPAANPYGFDALWRDGDFVARGTLIILIIMSMGSWYIIVTKLVEQARSNRRAKQLDSRFWAAPSLDSGLAKLDSGCPFRQVGAAGIEAKSFYHGQLSTQVDLNTWTEVAIERACGKVSSRMQDGLAFLATVGSTAPFVGLFGTVWGIYHALTAIGIAGQASIDKVAGPVGEALIMTAIGLAVAVPAVLGYNWLIRRNKSLMESVRDFGSQLHKVVLSTPQNERSNPAVRSA